jgi:hypothetical protein
MLIRHESFNSDARRLVMAIERVLAAPGAAAVLSALEARGAQPAGNAISEVAQQDPGPARNDPTRTARLVADAERIANSITDEHWKASALSSVAEALAATDPDRAARLFTDAARISNSITRKHWKASGLRASRRRRRRRWPPPTPTAPHASPTPSPASPEGIGTERHRAGAGRHVLVGVRSLKGGGVLASSSRSQVRSALCWPMSCLTC